VISNNKLYKYMSNLRNSVTLIGNLGKDPVVRNYGSGKKKATFSLATKESYRNQQGEKVTDTQWHNIVTWGHIAEIVSQFLKKGQEIAIEGRLSYRTYETPGGEKRAITEITAHEVVMLAKRAQT